MKDSLSQDSWNLKLSNSTAFDFVLAIVMVVTAGVAVVALAALPVVVVSIPFLASKQNLCI